jgi:uncharacterized coiled-coil DUF342 family protein
MENQIKLSAEELQEIQILRDAARENINEVGRLNIQKFFIQKEIDSVSEQIQNLYSETEKLNEREKNLVNEIVSKYGEGKLDFNTGLYSIN